MLCIELSRNGKRVATAGLPGKGVLSLIFNRVLSEHRGPEELRFVRLGGLDTESDPEAHVDWFEDDVMVGDEFVVRFVEREAADAPGTRRPNVCGLPQESREERLARLKALEEGAAKLRAELGLDDKSSL